MEDEGKDDWVLRSWFSKTIYVIGIATAVVIGASFLYGFVIGIFGL